MGSPDGQNGLVATKGPMKGLHAGMGSPLTKSVLDELGEV